MEPLEQIKRAETLCHRLRQATTPVGGRDQSRAIRSADPNELKKIQAYLLRSRDMRKLKLLVERLPGSPFARRSKSTGAYYRNIHTAFAGTGFYSLPAQDAIYVLGWACRLL